MNSINKKKLSSWIRLFISILVASIVAILLSWFVAPTVASFFSSYLGNTSQSGTPNSLLLIDLCLSTLFFFIGSLLSIKLARTRPYFAAYGVSFIGWLIYYNEAGGLNGMLHSMYPLWYEFFPSNFGSGWVAASLASVGRLTNHLTGTSNNAS